MAIDVNGFGMGGANSSPSKFYFERISAGSAGVISNISSAANNTPSRSVMTRLLNLQGPGRLHVLAVYGNGAYSRPGVQSSDITDVTIGNSQARLQIIRDDEDPIRKGAQLIRLNGTHYLLMKSALAENIATAASHNLAFTEPYVSNNTIRAYARTAEDPGSYPELESIQSLVSNGVLDMTATYYPNGLYFENSLEVYACFGNNPTSSSYSDGNGIWAVYELFE